MIWAKGSQRYSAAQRRLDGKSLPAQLIKAIMKAIGKAIGKVTHLLCRLIRVRQGRLEAESLPAQLMQAIGLAIGKVTHLLHRSIRVRPVQDLNNSGAASSLDMIHASRSACLPQPSTWTYIAQ